MRRLIQPGWILFQAAIVGYCCLFANGASADDAAGHFFDGNKLYAWCETYPEAALYYVIGTIDGSWANNKNILSYMACIPSNAVALQLKDISCQYLRNNPDKRQYVAASTVFSALSQAFPCNRH